MSSNPRIANPPSGIPISVRKGDSRPHEVSPTPSPVVQSACFPIVVHSHLRWSFVWQRPQHTHSRLAQRHPVLFVEEPIVRDDAASDHLGVTRALPNLWVVQPTLRPGPDAEKRTRNLLRSGANGLFRAQFEGAVHWLYTPMMESQIDLFPRPRAVVYDCMDELSKFALAPSELADREQRLLSRADLVFAGGYELGAAKARVHPNVHVFGCGVDFDHFQKAAEVLPASDIDLLPSPRIGYIGVIDERLDYELLGRLARELPRTTIVMIGPVVKVDPASLPKEPNIVYLGARPYEQLPEYLAGLDVCLMPFAMNEASYFINPTKTLEYLATGRPVVSTPVRDVVRQFRDVVHVAAASEFVNTVRDVLSGRRLDPAAGIERARGASWDKTVAAMELYTALAASMRTARGRRPVPSESTSVAAEA